jgi:tRNA G10  N-methylase Trm11
MQYLFVLGRNVDLSKAEIFSYVERERINCKGFSINSNGLLIDITREVDKEQLIRRLGGTIAIGQVQFIGSFNQLLDYIKQNEIYLETETKFTYTIMNFCNEGSFDAFLDELKQKFRDEKLKARYQGLRGNIKMQGGEVIHGSPAKIKARDVIYFIFEDSKSKKYSFGTVDCISDSKEMERRDMSRPVRREELAISPRLAKILINLSQVKENEILLDPFCGIGVVLQEAMLDNINVLGVEVDRQAVSDAEKNMVWFKNNYQTNVFFKILNDDSRKIVLTKKVEGIATEPALGVLLKSVPNQERAREMIHKFENLMIQVLNNLKKFLKPNTKIAFTAPLIKTNKGSVSCNITRICEETGLERYDLRICEQVFSFPIKEIRKEKVVNREFFVLERI